MYTNEFSKNLPSFLQNIKTDESIQPNDEDYPVHCFLKENDVKIDSSGSEICQFLKGKSIFITGGTGFLGKLLVEKLLRACIDIDSIFLLVREKNSKDQNTRFSELLDDVIFEKLEGMYPNYKSKVQVIHGDVGTPELGISDFDRKRMTEKVNVIFHVAATTRFDAHIGVAVAININGTKEVIKLAKECKNLVSLVHVSTAYSQCNKYHIEEKTYEPQIQADELISIARNLSKDQLQEATPKLLAEMPNTYTLTKHIAEHIITTEGKDLPISICRPSIVLSTAREPIKSWSDQIFGPVGFIAAVAVGLVRCMHGDTNMRCDLVPADYVINLCIACSYKNAGNTNPTETPVYNFTTEKGNLRQWKDIGSDFFYRQGSKIGSVRVVRFSSFTMVKSILLYSILSFLYEKTFAYVIDAAMYVMGKEPRLVKGYQKIDKFTKVLSFFTLNEFDFETKNTNDLWDSLNSQDKKAFPFNMKELDWDTYFLTFLVGLRVYIFKENLDDLEEGRASYRRAYYIYITCNAIIYSLLLLLTYKLLFLFF